MNLIDSFLNKITMYRLLHLFLQVLIGVAVILSLFKILPYNPFILLISTLFLVLVCWITNDIFANVFEAPTNKESATITALILALIVNPPKTIEDLIFLGWVAVLAMASKFILAINNKHIFNPAAIAVALTAFGIDRAASWWVGNEWMMPFVVAGGLLIVRKIRREDMVLSFFITAILVVVGFAIGKGSSIPDTLNKVLLHSSLFFFMFIMFTEPLTTPPTYWLQILYGVIVGFLFAPGIHFESIYSTPELALLVGNVYAYLVSPKTKLLLKLKEKVRLSSDTFDFIFPLSKPIAFVPGQYMEWTLAHANPDDRGNRRYFTVASSPTENTVRIGVKFYDKSSSFKKALLSIDEKSTVVASQLAGDFTLPTDPSQKLVFIAGGIGITPFRSMFKYLIDKKEKRDIVLMYSNKTDSEIVYKDILDQAQQQLGIRTVYTLTDKEHLPQGWTGESGRIDAAMITRLIPDYKERTFYLSGPRAMVTSYEEILKSMSIPGNQIKVDFFPGFV